jgi:hypothetical protein
LNASAPLVPRRWILAKLFLQNKMLQIEARCPLYPFVFPLDFIKNL